MQTFLFTYLLSEPEYVSGWELYGRILSNAIQKEKEIQVRATRAEEKI
jgi:hypothetical protein